MLFHRLEHVCFCVEKGEWPFPRRYPRDPLYDSRSSTPVPGTPGGSTPKPGTPLGAGEYSALGTPDGSVSGLWRSQFHSFGGVLEDDMCSDDGRDFRVALTEVCMRSLFVSVQRCLYVLKPTQYYI